MPEETVLVDSRRAVAPVAVSKARTSFVFLFLFLLLCFTTATVWIREAWPLQAFQIGIYLLVAAQILSAGLRRKEDLAGGLIPLLVYLIPVWGIVQIAAQTTTSVFDTRAEVLRWGALAGVFYLSQTITRSRTDRERLLNAILGFATAMAVLCLVQINTAHGSILWMIPTTYEEIYATFQNKNNFAQFIEVALPIALWGAVRGGGRPWAYALAGGVLYASAVSVASRAGFLLCTAELILVSAIGIFRSRGRASRDLFRSALATVGIMALAAGAFTMAVGWRSTLDRFNDKDPFAIRREYLLGAIEIAKHRPLTGSGLGTYVQVYQKYAVTDSYPFYANHAHNDWAEFAADGGLPFLALVSIPFLFAVPWMFQHPWALGLLATMINAGVDYPFPRPGVSGWMFALLGTLYVTRKCEREEPLTAGSSSRNNEGIEDGNLQLHRRLGRHRRRHNLGD